MVVVVVGSMDKKKVLHQTLVVKQSFFHLGALGGEGVAGSGSDCQTGVNGDP